MRKEEALPRLLLPSEMLKPMSRGRTTTTDEGHYRFNNVPVGNYEVTVEAPGFGKYVQSGITLALNQNAVVDASLKPGGVEAVVNVVENAAVINTSNAEVSTRFDSRRVSELPLGPNSQRFQRRLRSTGRQPIGFRPDRILPAASVTQSNGGRVRSNNFMIDGQDINDPSVSGGQQAINNPDIVQEVRLITNQFLAEYGRNSGSVLE